VLTSQVIATFAGRSCPLAEKVAQLQRRSGVLTLFAECCIRCNSAPSHGGDEGMGEHVRVDLRPQPGGLGQAPQAAGCRMAVHPDAAAVEQDRAVVPGPGCPVESPADRWRQPDHREGNEHAPGGKRVRSVGVHRSYFSFNASASANVLQDLIGRP
jgi:hypothetical protein